MNTGNKCKHRIKKCKLCGAVYCDFCEKEFKKSKKENICAAMIDVFGSNRIMHDCLVG